MSKIAVVAGGAKNLGGLISKSLGADGYGVVVHYNSPSTKEAALSTVHEIKSKQGQAWAVQADLTKVAKVEELFAFAKDKGKVYLAVNTVGKVLKKPIAETSETDYDSMFNINSKAAFFFIKSAGAALEEGGSIVSIVTALLAAFTPFYATYQGSKAPVEFFTKSAAKELMEKKITVNAVAPGPMDTPFFYPQESDDAVAYHKSQGLGGRLTKIEDVLPLIKLLTTGQHWITGQVIYTNGGYTAK
ncbi:short chain dehydrogenase [Naematelia encephala]|uniref:Short chain dehydrogenase n=1 Tax=Naematelia encephala TaxID=71784 RepID=A0A1Y2B0A2_9TREE|nr:short chain dehydrogenase [Naematelia encephala]